MKYYLAVEIEEKPYIQWHLWANSIEELAEMEEFENPLIVAASARPEYIFGVCPLKIVAGELVERTVPEMETFEVEFSQKETIDDNKGKLKDINNGSFGFSGNSYPMHESARLRYMAIALDSSATDTAFMNVDGVGILIAEANLPGFLTAYHKQIQAYTNTVAS